MSASIRGMMVVLLVVIFTTSSFAQSEKSWEEDSVAVLAQVEEFQLKINQIRKSAKFLGPVIAVSGGVFFTHAGTLFIQGMRDGGLFYAWSAFDNEIVQIEALVFYGSGAIAVFQGYRIQFIELRRWLLLKPYNRRYVKLEEGYKVVPKDS